MTVTETQPSDVGVKPDTRIYGGTPALNLALAYVQRALPRIDKGKTAEVPTKAGGKYTYSYADLADVSAQILPLLGENGLAFTTWPTLVGNRFVLRYELLHESGESKSGEYPLPMDAGAQALGSAITYARRYTICAVTGVAPDDDDDAAAADAKRQAEQAAERAEYDKEREQATQSVMGAWANQFGGWNGVAAAQMFEQWSKGGDVKQAPPAQLRAFTGYLLALPAADAGSDPATEQPPGQVEGEVRAAPADRPLGRKDNAHMFVLFEKLGMKDNRQGQLEYLRSVLGRDLSSRSDVRQADWPKLRAELEADVAEAERTGLAPMTGDEAAPAADRDAAGGSNRVPAASSPRGS